MNYFVRIAKADLSESAVVRIFPVDTGGVNGSARAANDFPHGSAPANCAYCHNTHTSLKEKLIKKASYYELCMVCHSNSNTQSKYDVEGGLVKVAGGTKPSLAGPFISQLGNPVISGHGVNDTAGEIPAVVPGGLNGTRKLGLNCVSCHTFHADATDNYRLLKKTIYADDGRTLVTSNINFKAYAVTSNSTSGEQISMISGNAEFCSACHADYDNGNAATAGGQNAPYLSSPPSAPLGKTRYRHPVSVTGSNYSVVGNDGLKNPALTPASGDVLPLQYNPSQTGTADMRTLVVCTTCHFAHGSTKSFNAQAGSVEYEGKYMMRLDNYGVCESCHKK